MSLALLQREFCAYLRDGDAAIAAQVARGARRGLAVYHHAYRANLAACLADTFEKTRAWLGDDAFAQAAQAHIARRPPSSWTLSDYGLGFDETLAGLYPDDAEVEELAWLDWSLRRAFDGPDSVVQDPATLAEVDWDIAALRLAPTLAVRPAATNAAAIWSALATGDRPPAAEPLNVSAGLIVWRQRLSPRFFTAPRLEHEALAAAQAGQSFGEICQTLAAELPDEEQAAAFAGGLLGRWMADGVVIGVAAP